MDQESEAENFLYSQIVKNLSSLMSDVKLGSDGSTKNNNLKCVKTNVEKQPEMLNMNRANQPVSHKNNQLDYHQQQYFNQLQTMSIYAHIQQITALNQLYLQQNQQHLINTCCVWSGQIPTKTSSDTVYSKKVFVGGIPWSYDNYDIKNMFPEFRSIKIEWPLDEQNHKVKGFTYVVFESEDDVKMLLDTCKKKGSYFYETNSYFLKIMSSDKVKMIEIVPWKVSDSCYLTCPKQNLDSSKTAFVGGIHGKVSADALAVIMNDLFGGVAFVGIDVDEHNYPKGAGRIIFNNKNSYMRAVAAKFVQIKSGKIQKKLQIDPFIQDSLCSLCGFQRGKFFCREIICFNYFCIQCWNIRHSMNINFQGHSRLTRCSNSMQHASCNIIKYAGIKNNPVKTFVMPNEGNKTTTKKRFGKNKSSWMPKAKK